MRGSAGTGVGCIQTSPASVELAELQRIVAIAAKHGIHVRSM